MNLICFLLGTFYFLPVTNGCSYIKDASVEVYGIENELIYLEIEDYLKDYNQEFLLFKVEQKDVHKNVELQRKIHLVNQITHQMDGLPQRAKFKQSRISRDSNHILIADDFDNLNEYQISSNSTKSFNIAPYDYLMQLLDFDVMIHQETQYLICDYSLNGQTRIILYEEVLDVFEIKHIYTQPFHQNILSNTLVVSGNYFYRSNYFVIEKYQVENGRIIFKNSIKKKKNLCGQITNIKQFQVGQNTISFIDSFNYLASDLNLEDEDSQYDCRVFPDELITYDYYEPLKQLVVVTENFMIFEHKSVNLDDFQAKIQQKVFITLNYIVLVSDLKIAIFTKELQLLDLITYIVDFIVEVNRVEDKFYVITPNDIYTNQIQQQYLIKISQLNQAKHFTVTSVLDETCKIEIHYSLKKQDYQNLLLNLESNNFASQSVWDVKEYQKEINYIGVLYEVKQAVDLIEIPSLSNKKYFIIKDNMDKISLLICSTEQECDKSNQIQNEIQLGKHIWWLEGEDVYFAQYIETICYIYKYDQDNAAFYQYNEINVNSKIVKIQTDGIYIYILFEFKQNLYQLLYQEIKKQGYQKLNLPSIKDIFASPLKRGFLIIKLEKLLLIYSISDMPYEFFKINTQPLETNVIIFKKHFVLLMKSIDEREKIFEIYYFLNFKIELLGKSSLDNFSYINIKDVLVSLDQSTFYLKCQVQLKNLKRYALVAFRVDQTIYKSLIFIQLRNNKSQFLAISNFLLKIRENKIAPLVQLTNSGVCLFKMNDEIVTDFQDLVKSDNSDDIQDNQNGQGQNIDPDDKDDQEDEDEESINLGDSNFSVGSFLVMSVIEETLIYSLYKTFGRKRIEVVDRV